MKSNSKKIVYICSPFSGNVEKNTEAAKRYCQFAIDKGYIPFAPHLLLPQFMNEETERELALEFDISYLDRCDELWVCGPIISRGMKKEIEYALAKEKKMMIRRFENI